MSIESIIDDIIRREGGFVDHPADKGGPTKYGITAKTLGEWRNLGRDATREEVITLTEEEARSIYYKRYIVQPGFSDLPDPLRELLVDFGVHSGPERAIIALQEILGLPTVGRIGPMTRESLERVDMKWLYKKLLAYRIRFLGRIISSNRSQAVFAAGWMNRMAEFVEKMPC